MARPRLEPVDGLKQVSKTGLYRGRYATGLGGKKRKKGRTCPTGQGWRRKKVGGQLRWVCTRVKRRSR